jgi:hypothetical protein
MDRVTTIIDRLGHMSGTAFCARSPIACGLARVPATRLSGYFAHRITNAAAEGLNARIQAIRVSARGFRHREHFKPAIYFHCGGLDLCPATHSIPG